MRLLLDSQVVLWTMNASPRLSAKARGAISDPDNVIYVSAATPYELEWKKASGKLQFSNVGSWAHALSVAGYQELPISVAHSERGALLPKHHRDPWDRVLIAQAFVEALTLVTSDAQFAAYGVATLW